MEIDGDSADPLWGKAYKKLISKSSKSVDSRSGETLELGQVTLRLSDPRQRWVTKRSPAISIAFSLAEVVWIVSGSNDAGVINYWNPALPRFAGGGDKYHGAYGYRLRKRFGIDQLEGAYEALKSNSSTRQVVLSYYDPRIDLPRADGSPRSPDIPCNVVSLIKIRDGCLNWTQIMRSNDIVRGLPYNFVQFTSLQELLAGWLGVGLGSYTHFTDSLHVYKADSGVFSETRALTRKNGDTLCMTKAQSDHWFSLMYSRMKKIASKGKALGEEELARYSILGSNVEGLNNMMCIIGVYAARKEGLLSLERSLLRSCTNLLFVEMWNRWVFKKNRTNDNLKFE